MTPPTPPAKTSPLVHVKRALGWNLARVLPSQAESVELYAAGIVDPVAQRYATWRRSLLLVALLPTVAAVVLAALDMIDAGLGEQTVFGLALDGALILSMLGLPVACVTGLRSWTRPGPAARRLTLFWVAAFVLPFVYALVPASMLYHVGPEQAASVGAALSTEGSRSEALAHAAVSAATPDKLEALHHMALEFVLSGSGYLMLLPAVLSLIPGAINGCLRAKSLLPAAALPGWLLVCAAPAFLLFWLVVLVLANHAAQSPLLVLGVVLWAGSPIVYSLQGRVFVQPRIGEAEEKKIGRAKRFVGLVGLAGVALLLGFVLTTKVLGLRILGLEREAAMNIKLHELSEGDDEISLGDVTKAFDESSAFVYALDLSSFRMVVDFLAKLLVVTAVFADLALRATLAAWRDGRALRERGGASALDASAGATSSLLGADPA